MSQITLQLVTPQKAVVCTLVLAYKHCEHRDLESADALAMHIVSLLPPGYLPREDGVAQLKKLLGTCLQRREPASARLVVVEQSRGVVAPGRGDAGRAAQQEADLKVARSERARAERRLQQCLEECKRLQGEAKAQARLQASQSKTLAAVSARNQELADQNKELQSKVAELKARVAQLTKDREDLNHALVRLSTTARPQDPGDVFG